MSARDWRIFPSPSVQCLNWGGGDRWCRHLSSLWEFRRANSPVWCSRPRPTTSVLLALYQDEFRGPRSDYVGQVALATQQQIIFY
ncbi:uncharacterized protein TNCV_2262291 [Trichonephila clavipes]|nr:uncharacterized protein TNCV_2262291 [Trichonephila clavipes]